MATITKYAKKNGITYKVEVRRKGYYITRRFRLKSEAETWARRIETEIDAGTYDAPQISHITVHEALEIYWRTASQKKKPSTIERERRVISAIRARIGHLMLQTITPVVAAAYRDKRLMEVSAYTVRLELALLSDMFERGRKEWGWDHIVNPIRAITRPSPPPGRTFFLTPKEAERLLAACAESRNKMLHPYITLLLRTGMRPGEAAGLRCEQIDQEHMQIVLTHTKTGKPRNIPISKSTMEMLSPLMTGKQPSDTIFGTQDRQHVHPAGIFRKAFECARKRAELSHIHLHDLRHTAASWLILQGVDLRTLAEILGHQTMQMVMRYTHILDDTKRKALEKIEIFSKNL